MSWLARKEKWTSQDDDARDAGDVDHARVIHSASFRRLQGKTQILNLGDSDFYRTRLTHSLEVAQIAGSIVKQLGKSRPGHPAAKHISDRSMIQAIGCAHDLGHPPFGHGGEVALNYCMRDSGGFEGNGQTLRILSRLENFSADAGANLTRRTLLGVLKYPVAYSVVRNPKCDASLEVGPTTIKVIDRTKSKPPKCFLDSEADIVSWILEPLSQSDQVIFQKIEHNAVKHHKPIHKSFDCSVMDIADDVAYGVHDLEDAIALRLVTERRFREAVPDTSCSCLLDALKSRYPDETKNSVYDHCVKELFGDSGSRKHCINRLVHHFVTAIEIIEFEQFEEPLLRFRAKIPQVQHKFLETLKMLVIDDVIKSPSVQHIEFKGQMMVVAVFEAIQTDPKRLLPRDAFERFANASGDMRAICDYVAGMTDSHLLRTYDRLFSPRMGSVFDKL
jgi:dGTPase